MPVVADDLSGLQAGRRHPVHLTVRRWGTCNYSGLFLRFVSRTKVASMVRTAPIDPLSLLTRRADPTTLRKFFAALDELLPAAFADSARAIKAKREDRPAVYARGTYRRMRLDEAFRTAARSAKLRVSTKTTTPATWCFPVVETGAFSITLAVVDRLLARGPRRLRCRGDYMKKHVAKNGIMNPQGQLRIEGESVRRLVPNSSIGALVVVEPSLFVPDAPLYVGLWIPSPNLKRPFFRIRLDRLIEFLTGKVADKRGRKSIVANRRKPAIRRTAKRKEGH